MNSRVGDNVLWSHYGDELSQMHCWQWKILIRVTANLSIWRKSGKILNHRPSCCLSCNQSTKKNAFKEFPTTYLIKHCGWARKKLSISASAVGNSFPQWHLIKNLMNASAGRYPRSSGALHISHSIALSCQFSSSASSPFLSACLHNAVATLSNLRRDALN